MLRGRITSKTALTIHNKCLSSAPKKLRVPMIKFLGKRSHLKAPLQQKSASAALVSPATVSSPPKQRMREGSGVDFMTLNGGAWYGRPRLSQKEMDAIESGGAF